MVNYLYDIGQTERIHESFALMSTMTASRGIQELAAAESDPTTKEPTQ